MPPKKKAPASKTAAPKPSGKKSVNETHDKGGKSVGDNKELLGRLMPLLSAQVQNENQGANSTSNTSTNPPQLFPGDIPEPEGDSEPPAKLKGKAPSPKKGKKGTSTLQVDWAQLFQSLCLSVRLELAHRRRGETCRLSKSLVVLDEQFLNQLRSLYFGGGQTSQQQPGGWGVKTSASSSSSQSGSNSISIAHMIELQARLPSKLVIHRPKEIISQQQQQGVTSSSTSGATGSTAVVGELDPSAVMVDSYSLHLNVDAVPSLDEVITWLDEEGRASASEKKAPVQRAKRGREDEATTVKPDSSAAVGGAVQPVTALQPSTNIPTFGNFPKHVPKPAASGAGAKPSASTTTGGGGTSSAGGVGDLAKYLSQEKLAAVLESKKTAMEAEDERASAELQQDYERLLPLYDRVLSIIGASRRCYALSRLTMELQSLGRTAGGGGGVGAAANNQPSDILRQLRILVTFKDAGMEEVQPKRLFVGGDGESSEDGAGFGGTAASSEENTSISGPGLLVLDITKCHRLRLSAAIERKKDELGF